MARRKKTSPLDDLISIACKLPWWVSLIIAGVSYLVCHRFAMTAVPVGTDMAHFGSSVLQAAIKGFAMLFQYVLPIIFIVGAAVSAITQARRPKASASFAPSKAAPPPSRPWKSEVKPNDLNTFFRDEPLASPTYDSEMPPSVPRDITRWSAELLTSLDWKRFEEVCAGLFERLGFTAKVAGVGPDEGIDIHLYRPPAEQPVAIVQCKSRTNRKVGVEVVRALHGVMTSKRVTEGILATSGEFSEDARRYGTANNIDMMDGAKVLKAIQALPSEQQGSLLKLATQGDYTTPTCAACGIKLVMRQAQSTGRKFWGCVNYPRCRSLINIAGA